MNWSGVERATPNAISLPTSEEELSQLIAGTNGRVRPFGSGHSFTGLVPSEGVMVDVSRLAGLQSIDAETGHATFGAGTRLFQMATELAGAGLALPNLPDIDVQTLAGHSGCDARNQSPPFCSGARLTRRAGRNDAIHAARGSDV